MDSSNNNGNSDDLVITSIGALYNGPWDKKYWSSSRGKDRYPYPVGYQAIRTYNGSICRIEIHEGLKGPLFLINSNDGHSCSGQTPDIAWDSFQKKGSPGIKMTYKKRSSCKINAVEFFGFRNPFVQRLLRELVANVSETAQQSLPSSSFYYGISERESGIQCPDSCTYTNIPSSLKKPLITKKRIRQQKAKINIINKDDAPKHKKLLPTDNDNQPNGTCNYNNTVSSFAFDKDHSICDHLQDALEAVDLNAANHKNISLCPFQSGLHLNSSQSCDTIKEDTVIPQVKSKHVSPKNCASVKIINNISANEEFLDRSHDSDMSRFNSLMPTEDNDANVSVPKDFSGFTHANLCVPDTLDPLQVDSSIFAPICPNEINFDMKDSVAPIADAFTKLHSGGNAAPSNQFSEMNESDFVDQEISKSMMNVLLPQALPLLKTTRKQKVTDEPSKTSHYKLNSGENDNKNDHLVVVTSTVATPVDYSVANMPVFSTGLSESELTKSVIPDSFDSEKCLLTADNLKQVDKEIPSDDGKHVMVDKSLIETALDCSPPQIKVFVRRSKNVNKNIIGSTRFQKSYSNEKELTSAPNCNPVGTPVDYSMAIKEEKFDICKDLSSGLPEWEHTKSVIPDSFDSDKCLLTATDLEPVGSEDVERKPSNCFHWISGNKANSADDGQFSPDEKSLLVDKHTFETASGKSSPKIKVFAKRPRNANKNCNGSIRCQKTYSKEMEFTYDPNCKPEKSQVFVDGKMVGDQCDVESISRGQDISKLEISLCNNGIPDVEKPYSACLVMYHGNIEGNNGLKGIVDLVGCYVHPMTVSSLLLRTTMNEIFICVLCGHLMGKDKTLFLYKVPFREQRPEPPFFIGYTQIILPTSIDNSGRDIMMEQSCLQFTPDGNLVVIDKIKVPYCREQKIDCSCPTCASISFGRNGVKILQVELGYVSVTGNFKIAHSVHCILVCGPCHLVAVEESGCLHIWVMNELWSSQAEEFIMPIYDFIVVIKKIPRSNCHIVGHNDHGEFYLWDISKRILISRFSAPSTTIYDFLPLSLFCWESKGPASSGAKMEEYVNRIMGATKKYFTNQTDDCCALEANDMAVWILVSTSSNHDVPHYRQENDSSKNFGEWRLGLLVKNSALFGDSLDSRASAISVCADRGIIGTRDGVVYLYEISTGIKLGNLHYFKDEAISCIAVDDSRPRLMGVATEGGQLRLYLISSLL